MKDFRSYLRESQVLDSEQFEQLSPVDSHSPEPVYYEALRKWPEREGAIWQGLADFLQVELVQIHEVRLDRQLRKLVPARIAHDYSLVPLHWWGNRLEIVLADPAQFDKCDEFAMLLTQSARQAGMEVDDLTVIPLLARPSQVAEMIKWLYGIGADTVQDALAEPSDGEIGLITGSEIVDLTGIGADSEDAAIVKFVNQLMLEAVKAGASDIHIEPFENNLRVRYRVDGMLREESVPEKIKHLEPAIISRVKIMARLDIAEKRLPQDGQIRLRVMGRPIDVRVSVLPTLFGQGLALRLLDQQEAMRELDNLGMEPAQLSEYRRVLELSHGVVLVTGPTGSGKTTTLYAAINEINSVERKIITVEDPIEYQLAGIAQIQVKPTIDLTFANALRSILRHDPDVIMVGEIRDRITAQIAISAAMTGHLVFSTLHTNDAPSAPVRLLEMGVEPYLVSSALEAVAAQRLVRVLCRNCRRKVKPAEVMTKSDASAFADTEIYAEQGCHLCRDSGFAGRTGIFEMFTLNAEVRQMILNFANSGQIRESLCRKGMQSLRDAGLCRVRQGLTSVSEVYRVAREGISAEQEGGQV